MPKPLNLVGQKFNRLTVIERVENSKNGKSQWLCQCECGNTCVVLGSNLKNSNTKSCGCLDRELINERRVMGGLKNVKDLIGQEFGRLTVVERHGSDKHQKATWLCKCACGDEVVVRGTDLIKGATKSCGCLKNEIATKRLQDLNEIQKGENHPMYGKHHTEETREKMRNPNLTDEDRQDRRCISGYYEWKQEVKKQAKFTCDLCGDNRGGNLHSHHLDSYDLHRERRLDVTNGVCLCESCHKDFHHYYGYGDNLEEDYLEYKYAYENN